ncbi:MAG TPA: hypothetical protein VMS31_13890 [Pyrinomonadaceae bacterium]|nr:hypothetical protein [Pyrinomonadaceae bacterium]
MLRATITSVSENDQHLISFIATTVETLRDQFETMRQQMVTKEDLAAVREQMATKRDLAEVKDQVARVEARVDDIETKMATKDDLAAVATKQDLGQMATKNDLSRLETTMHGEFEQVHIRLDSIDRSLSNRIGHIESEVSRLRSVLYWLVKDKPEMLRLLGRPTPGEDPLPS